MRHFGSAGSTYAESPCSIFADLCFFLLLIFKIKKRKKKNLKKQQGLVITQSHVWHFRAGSAADFQQPEARQGGRGSGGVGGGGSKREREAKKAMSS